MNHRIAQPTTYSTYTCFHPMIQQRLATSTRSQDSCENYMLQESEKGFHGAQQHVGKSALRILQVCYQGDVYLPFFVWRPFSGSEGFSKATQLPIRRKSHTEGRILQLYVRS